MDSGSVFITGMALRRLHPTRRVHLTGISCIGLIIEGDFASQASALSHSYYGARSGRTVCGGNRRRSRTGCAGADRFMSDNAVWSVLLQAFNTETTENHEGPRSGSDDISPKAVLQQARMEIEQEAEGSPLMWRWVRTRASCAGRRFATARISIITFGPRGCPRENLCRTGRLCRSPEFRLAVER